MKVKSDHRSKFSNLSNWIERRSLKKSGPQRDSNPWPPWYRCDSLPTELWSHTLGARSICWSHISREEMKVKMIVLDFHLPPQFTYELFHINFTSFHCTERYELNKLTSLPMCGFIAQLVEHRTDIAEVTGSNPVEALIFSGFFFPIA